MLVLVSIFPSDVCHQKLYLRCQQTEVIISLFCVDVTFQRLEKNVSFETGEQQ